MTKFRLLAVVGSVALLIGGCGTIRNINTKTKEKKTTTGLFRGDMQKMSDAVKAIDTTGKGTMTKTEVANAGFDFNAENVECLRGSAAMPLLVGNVQNTMDLSTPEKIEAYAITLNRWEACIFREHQSKSEKTRLYFSKAKSKTRGKEMVFVISFKDGVLFSAKESLNKPINETDTDKAWGGNVLEMLLGAGAKFKP